MKEIFGDLWEVECDVRVITTNGTVKRNGACVMGRGVALQAKQRFPKLPYELGRLILKYGNIVLTFPRYKLVTFPVKWKWFEKADLFLIERSAKQLVKRADTFGFRKIVLPRPGCGNGKRDWEKEVKPILEKILDNRFYVISQEKIK
ncbi:MAG: ADP-ribose-binding protein [Promethearchaeota archaeon]